MRSHISFTSLAHAPARSRYRDDATFDGPLRLLVAGGLAYLVWLIVQQGRATTAATPEVVENATLLS